jgi:hypothetical protein
MSEDPKKALLTKLAESWWDTTKRHYGYAAPSWLGGDARPNFRNKNKFLPMKDAPRSAEDQAKFLEKRRSKTRVGYANKPGSDNFELPENIRARRDAIVNAWEKKQKLPKARTSPATSSTTRKPTAYEEYMKQAIPLEDQPQQSLEAPRKSTVPSASLQTPGFNIKMRRGRGYNWLAKELNKRNAGGGEPAKAITGADLRKRMGNQMLYSGRGYSFNPGNLAKAGPLTGGLNAKQVTRAQRGMSSFVSGRKKRRAGVDEYAKANNLRSYADTLKARPKYRRSQYDRRISNVRGSSPIVQQLSRGEITSEEANKQLRRYGRRVAVGKSVSGGAPRVVGTSLKPGGYDQAKLQSIANEGRNSPPTTATR